MADDDKDNKQCELCGGWTAILMQGFANLQVCPSCRYGMQLQGGQW